MIHNLYTQFCCMPTWLYISRASNMTMYDLTSYAKPPANVRALLGLNLKFIPRKTYTTFDMNESIQRFTQSVYIQGFYINNPQPEESNTNNHDSKIQSCIFPPIGNHLRGKLRNRSLYKQNPSLRIVCILLND